MVCNKTIHNHVANRDQNFPPLGKNLSAGFKYLADLPDYHSLDPVTKVKAESEEEGVVVTEEREEQGEMSYPGPDQLQSVMEDELGYRVQQFGQHR